MSDRRLRELERALAEQPSPETRWALVRALVRYQGLTHEAAHRRVVGLAPGDVLGRYALRSGYLHLEPVWIAGAALCGSRAQRTLGPLLVSQAQRRMVRRARTLGSRTRVEWLDGAGDPFDVGAPCLACFEWSERLNAQLHQRTMRGELPWVCLMGEHVGLVDCAVKGCGAVWRAGRWVEA